jgi:hypothetical protein
LAPPEDGERIQSPKHRVLNKRLDDDNVHNDDSDIDIFHRRKPVFLMDAVDRREVLPSMTVGCGTVPVLR